MKAYRMMFPYLDEGVNFCHVQLEAQAIFFETIIEEGLQAVSMPRTRMDTQNRQISIEANVMPLPEKRTQAPSVSSVERCPNCGVQIKHVDPADVF